VSTLFTFPGQGAQRAGMLHDLPHDQPHDLPHDLPHDATVIDTLDEASDALGQDVLTLDGAGALRSTVSTQLCLLIAGVAMARHLESRAQAPNAVAGLSVGAYAAAVTAAVIGFRDAVRMVALRARLMASAYPSGHGMTAILGLDAAALEPLIAQVHGAASPVYLANINAPTQLVIAGATAAMQRVAALALARGANAAKPIAIEVPSHCELLAEPAAALAEAMAGVPAAQPRMRYYSASLARELRDPRRIVDDLAFNMAARVRWHETSVLAGEHGVRLAVEMPPGSVLTKLSTIASLPEGIAVAAADTRTDTVVELMAREARRDH
jgi:malonate decarboxylase epsilon subunit